MEPERAEAGAADVGPRRHGAGVEREHDEGFHGEHVLGQPGAAGEAEGDLGDAVQGGVLDDGAERRGRDGAVRGEGEASDEERRGGPQRVREVGLVEGERVNAFEEPGDLAAEVAGHAGEPGGGAGREAVEDAAEEVLGEVGEAIGALPGRGPRVTAAALALAGAAAHRGRLGVRDGIGGMDPGFRVRRVRGRCSKLWGMRRLLEILLYLLPRKPNLSSSGSNISLEVQDQSARWGFTGPITDDATWASRRAKFVLTRA